jgi:hypothetical protein
MSKSYNKPYLWEDDPRIPEKCYVFYNWKERKTNELIFMSGKPLPKPDIGQMPYSQDPATYDLIFDVQVEEARIGSYDYLPNNTSGPLVNKRVLELLQEMCPNDFQAFPAIIRSRQDKPITPYVIENEYSLINVTRTVGAFDKELSEFDTLPENLGGMPIGLRYMVLNDKAILGNYCLARDKDLPSQVIVSPVIKDAFKKAKIKGARFVTDEEYNRDYFY